MTLREEAIKAVEDVPLGKLPDLIQFARFLRSSLGDDNSKVQTEKQKRDRPRLLGALEGKIWISDDFNDPLEFVSPEEMRVLETMRANKKTEEHESELQEEAV